MSECRTVPGHVVLILHCIAIQRMIKDTFECLRYPVSYPVLHQDWPPRLFFIQSTFTATGFLEHSPTLSPTTPSKEGGWWGYGCHEYVRRNAPPVSSSLFSSSKVPMALLNQRRRVVSATSGNSLMNSFRRSSASISSDFSIN